MKIVKKWLGKVLALQDYWQEPSLWSHAVIAEDFSSLSFPLDDIDSALLETAVQQKLSQVGLILSDLPKLLPFFLTRWLAIGSNTPSWCHYRFLTIK
ncbi:hypothetical protein OL548_09175 [Lysinibacillus sp. MHQ-1]|nr:hypothetical protein OL548_09175 [Lysinibacillus sp. MHQ-1]